MKSYVVGNWKMNFTVGESSLYLHKLLKRLKPHRGLEIVAAPSTIALQPLSLQIDRKKLKLSAQNCFDRDYGAYTGEVSATQLRTLVDYCIIGHSERRYHFHESDKDIKNKVAACLRNNITPILCIGETASERDFGETKDVIKDQLLGGLSEVPEENQAKVIIAYEPVWAISSVKGAKLASPTDVAEVINIIRDFIPKDAPLLFGGSVNPSNAGGYLTIPGINGLLVGGSSLIADEFLNIIEVANRVKS